ncbi:MAG: hypothetical protein J6C67_05150 [Muribaculaceae bacterium]|nr:hypothetical protein [Muribaculaceae bacterium]
MPADDDGIDHNGLQSCSEDISQNRKRKYGRLRPNKEQNDKNLHHNSTLATIIGSYKAAVTRQARRNNLIVTRDSLSQSDATCGRDVSRPYKVWQRSFHDRIIRSQQALDNIMFYVDDNVRRWSEDCFRE